jgi:hydrogenase maturation protease
MSDATIVSPCAPAKTRRVVVLSIGNLLRADDGLGGYALAELRRRVPEGESLAYVDGGVIGLELFTYVEGCDALIVLDAIDARRPPGTLIRLEGPQVPVGLDTKLSMHQAGLRDLLATLQLLGRMPQTVVLLGLQPATIGWGAEPSELIRAHLPELVAAAEREIDRLLHAAVHGPLAGPVVGGGRQGITS